VGRIVGGGVVGFLLGNAFFEIVVVGRMAFVFRGDRGCIGMVDIVLRGVVVDLLVMNFLLGNVFVRRLLRGLQLMLMRVIRPLVGVLCEEKTCDLVVEERNAFGKAIRAYKWVVR
jgi:hypothetical protein